MPTWIGFVIAKGKELSFLPIGVRGKIEKYFESLSGRLARSFTLEYAENRDDTLLAV